MQIETKRFGTIEIGEDKLIEFPTGLLGFEELRRYLLIDSDEAAPMRWLLSVDEPELAFLVIEPTPFFPDYKVQVSQEDHDALGLTELQEAVVACLVVVPEDPAHMTVNLMGPLVLNTERRLGRQVVLHDSGYSTRQRLLPDAANHEEPALV